MTRSASAVSDEVLRRYSARDREIPFGEFVGLIDATDDDLLADLIEIDARARLAAGQDVPLTRYVEAVEDLHKRPTVLDAAIDFTLRGMIARAAMSVETAAKELTRDYPRFEAAIRRAAELHIALPTTSSLSDAMLSSGPGSVLPTAIGPLLRSGRRRYELCQLLGSGGSGQVFRAVDHLLSHPDKPAWVAIKLLRYAGSGRVIRDWIRDEACKARRISHPNVVRVLDLVEDHDRVYIVCEYVEGSSLAEHLATRGGSLPPKDAAEILARTAHGVQAIHANGIVHLDLKPANIMIASDGTPKLTDFGVSLRVEEGVDGFPKGTPSAVGGTVAYMAPEQKSNGPETVTTRADTYALGVILRQTLSGDLVRTPSADDRPARRLGFLRDRLPWLFSTRSAADRDLDAIIERATATSPDERFSSAEAFGRALEDWIAFRSLPWSSPTAWWRASLFVQRNRLAAAMLILFTTMIAIGTGWTVYLSEQQQIRRLQERNEIQERAIDQVQTAVSSLLQALARSPGDSIGAEWLPTLFALEKLTAPISAASLPGVTGVSDQPYTESQIQVLRSLVKTVQDQGRADEIDSLLWEAVLGYWLVVRGAFADADDVLMRNEQAWSKRVGPDDLWTQYVRGLRACALVGIAREEIDEQPPRSEVLATLRTAVGWLEAATDSMPDYMSASPSHQLMLRQLELARKLLDPDAPVRTPASARPGAADRP